VHSLDSLKVISFYDFDEIEPLLYAKYHPCGSFALKYLAKKAFAPFFGALELDNPAALLPIDDRAERWFSHTAVLAKYAANGCVHARFGRMRAKSAAAYAGKTLAFRHSNPRRFDFKPFDETDVILLDDLMTTGTTLNEARSVVENAGKNALFAVTLAKAA
jgi:competence protein ComFC